MWTAEVLIVVRNAESVFVVEGAVQFAECCVLVEASSKRAGGCLHLGCERRIIGEETRIQTVNRRAIVDGQRLVADLALKISQIEEAIVHERSPDRASDLLPAVMRRFNSLLFINLVVGAESGVEDVVVGIAVNLTGSAFGDGIHKSAAGLAKFGLEAGAGDLKLADYVLAELVGDAGAPDLLGEEGIVVIAAVHGVIVVVPGNAIEADHPEVAIGGGARRQQSKIREIAPIEWKRLNASLVHDRPQRGRRGVNQGRLGSNGDRGVYLTHRKLGMENGASSNRDRNVLEDHGGKPGFPDRNFIRAGIEVEDDKFSFSAGTYGRHSAGILIAHRDLSFRDRGARGVGHGSLQSTSGGSRLRLSASRKQQQHCGE